MLISPYFKQVFPSGLDSDPASLASIKYNLDVIFNQLVSDLWYFYVTDTGFTFIDRDFLKSRSISEADLHDYACSNLRLLLNEKIKVVGNKRCITITLDGNLEASLLLIDEVWDQLENQLGGNIIVAVPSRDVVVAMRVDNENDLVDFEHRVDSIYANGIFSISKNLFYRVNGKWSVFKNRA